jgi:hypothetical protein
MYSDAHVASARVGHHDTAQGSGQARAIGVVKAVQYWESPDGIPERVHGHAGIVDNKRPDSLGGKPATVRQK